ncbi:WhiB family transcriptional regulator [Streptomyces bungoensis]|uniref:WhiB family transcriptional regulator n=1 Tax=Streptomyces bungoensis TaxID=285568 RepID=UPI00343207A0
MTYIGSVPDTAPRRLDWMADMACRQVDPDLFSEPEHQHEARLICAVRCPVRAQCLAQVKRMESGTNKDKRECVVAGLTAYERWRLDADAPGHGSGNVPALVVTGEPPACGTYTALLRHLWLGEPVDPDCWSAEVRRDRLNRATGDARPHRKKEPQAAPPAPLEAVPQPRQAAKPQPKRRGRTAHERRIYRLWSTGVSDLGIARAMAISVPYVARVRERLGLLENKPSEKAAS